MFAEIAGVIGSAASGGILGAALGVGTKFFQERQRQQWAQKEWDHELNLLQLQASTRKEETEAEGKIVADAGQWKAMGQTYKAEAVLLSSDKIHPIILSIRALWRPALTAMLYFGVGLLWWSLIGLVKGTSKTLSFLDMATVHDLLSTIVNSIVFSANTAGMWWFADRASSMPHYKNK